MSARNRFEPTLVYSSLRAKLQPSEHSNEFFFPIRHLHAVVALEKPLLTTTICGWLKRGSVER
ncbi:MAG: hypothetical protein ACR2NU_01325, partial [Aeoliella sp.]